MSLDPIYCINCKKQLGESPQICAACGQNQRERPKRLQETQTGMSSSASATEDKAAALAQFEQMRYNQNARQHGEDDGGILGWLGSWFVRRIVIGLIVGGLGVFGRLMCGLPPTPSSRSVQTDPGPR
jgi:hypothetical protein